MPIRQPWSRPVRVQEIRKSYPGAVPKLPDFVDTDSIGLGAILRNLGENVLGFALIGVVVAGMVLIVIVIFVIVAAWRP